MCTDLSNKFSLIVRENSTTTCCHLKRTENNAFDCGVCILQQNIVTFEHLKINL